MIARRNRLRWLVAPVAVLVAAVGAPVAHADLIDTGACDNAALSQPFAPFGDNNYYRLAPGGDFESGAAGWALDGSQVVSGSEPFAATGNAGSFSLSLPAGSSATSPTSCVNFSYPSYRFFVRNDGGLLDTMTVELLYKNSALELVGLPLGLVVGPHARWVPGPVELSGSAVGGLLAGGTAPVALEFTPVIGHWYVDDVYIDPYHRF